GIDFIAASFVRDADAVKEIKAILKENGAEHIDVIAKIENSEGIQNIDKIINAADGIMVARGDMGVEIPAYDVPHVQKMIVQKCNQKYKPVIIATQMLDSMITYPRPTRAEVSDVANAIFDGADAIMLSGETAAGAYPVQAVEMMARVASRAEEGLPWRDLLLFREAELSTSLTDAISYATCATAARLDIKKIITLTRSGRTSRLIARYRPEADIVAVTPNPRVMRKLALCWGVYPVLQDEWQTGSSDALMTEALRHSEDKGYIRPGDMVVITGGSVAGFSGATNMIKVQRVGQVLAEGTGIGNYSVTGRARVIRHDEDLLKIEPGDIAVMISAGPALASWLGKLGGIVAESGGLTCDAAIMALSSGLPALIGVANATAIIPDGDLISLVPESGKVFAD
ncbi:MAG: pyruvate kinase, partial [Syntrophomonadaceae bacterium]|nr:pyruvate kinase [Syntrophomonadaceae bacterium]